MTQTQEKRGVKAPKIPTGNIEADFLTLVRHAKSLLTRYGYVHPTLFMMNSQEVGMHIISGQDLPEDPDIKRVIFQNIGESMATDSPNLDCFMFISEAWVSRRDTIEGVRPSEDPQHMEILMVAAKRINGDERHCLIPFKKEGGGKVTFIKNKDMAKINKSGWSSYKSIKNGGQTQNALLSALWQSFLFNRIVK